MIRFLVQINSAPFVQLNLIQFSIHRGSPRFIGILLNSARLLSNSHSFTITPSFCFFAAFYAKTQYGLPFWTYLA